MIYAYSFWGLSVLFPPHEGALRLSAERVPVALPPINVIEPPHLYEALTYIVELVFTFLEMLDGQTAKPSSINPAFN
jgi:hypothetical protein